MGNGLIWSGGMFASEHFTKSKLENHADALKIPDVQIVLFPKP